MQTALSLWYCLKRVTEVAKKRVFQAAETTCALAYRTKLSYSTFVRKYLLRLLYFSSVSCYDCGKVFKTGFKPVRHLSRHMLQS